MTLQLRVATFNIRHSSAQDGDNAWPVRRAAAAAAIEGFDADVIGLQEVLPDQLDYLRQRFDQYEFIGVGREDGVSAGEQTTVMIRSGEWQLASAETRWLSAEPSVPGSVGWDADQPRIATLIRLRHTDGTMAGVANTHFDHIGEVARVESSRLLDRWLSAEADLPWVLLGDLNEEPGTAPLKALTSAGWRDAVPADEPGTFHDFTGTTDCERIDHILLSPAWQVTDAAVTHPRPGGRLPSDHWPVVATLTLRASRNS